LLASPVTAALSKFTFRFIVPFKVTAVADAGVKPSVVGPRYDAVPVGATLISGVIVLGSSSIGSTGGATPPPHPAKKPIRNNEYRIRLGRLE